MYFSRQLFFMKNYTVRLYKKEDFKIWNSFVETAKNATFLFNRDFMEYHSDRFDDFSLLVFENDKLVSILPANRLGASIFSHQGLTYGGLILNEKSKLIEVISIFKNVLIYLNKLNIEIINIKMIPNFYADGFNDEINYILFLLQAKKMRCDTYSVLNLQKEFKITSGRKEGIAKGIQNKLICKEETNFESFWNEILIPNLLTKHSTKPVHSLKEIQLLHKKFPYNIRQFNVYQNNKIIAGTTIFESKNVAHSQYISGNETKNETGSLDFLYNSLIKNVFKEKSFFDFGTSNEQEGKVLNNGLLFWKESFGAKTVTQNFYEVKTQNFKLLENILI